MLTKDVEKDLQVQLSAAAKQVKTGREDTHECAKLHDPTISRVRKTLEAKSPTASTDRSWHVLPWVYALGRCKSNYFGTDVCE